MNPLKPLTTPEYLFRPSQIVRRFGRALGGKPDGQAQVTLPWGDIISVRTDDVIGAGIYCYGIFDLVVAEAIRRLLDPGETALDIGSNIGQMASLMRHCCGERGEVHAFEPHPELFADLERLVGQPSRRPVAPVRCHPVGLSDRSGEAEMALAAGWDKNRGLGKIASGQAAQGERRVRIRIEALDALLPPPARIGVAKMDVEGHEAAVLSGASALLSSRRVRDWIFEDFEPFPSPVHRVFLDAGYALYSLHSGILGPHLRPVSGERPGFTRRDGENYLATLDPARAECRFTSGGWKALRSGLFFRRAL